MKILDKVAGALQGFSKGANGLEMELINAEVDGMRTVDEALTPGEAAANITLSADEYGWNRLLSNGDSLDFPRESVRMMISLARLMYLFNPLIHRAVSVQELYVWGSGVDIKGDEPEVDETLRDFFLHPKNQRVIGQKWDEREREQRLEGNTFMVFYRNKSNGTAVVRLFPFEQIRDIIYNPDDRKEPWFYRRIVPGSGSQSEKDELYPDIDYQPKSRTLPNLGSGQDDIRGLTVKWDNPVLHICTGGTSQMKYGIPEIFCSLAWATAYKKILENFATILSAYARMAMQITGLGGKSGIAAAKSKMNTGITQGNLVDTNPAPNAASWAFLSGNAKVSAIKTSNSTTAPEEARELQLMVAAGTDLPIHFFGDSDIGNYATSATLDRPTELKMISRQRMWLGVIERICRQLKIWSCQAPQGRLRKAGYTLETTIDPFDGSKTVIITPPSGKSITESIRFPNILERDVVDRIRAVVQAVTLGGSQAEGIFPKRSYVFRLLLEAMGMDDIKVEKWLEECYPKEIEQGFLDPADQTKNDRIEADAQQGLADAAKIAAKKAPAGGKPKPSPSGSPKPAVSNK